MISLFFLFSYFFFLIPFCCLHFYYYLDYDWILRKTDISTIMSQTFLASMLWGFPRIFANFLWKYSAILFFKDFLHVFFSFLRSFSIYQSFNFFGSLYQTRGGRRSDYICDHDPMSGVVIQILWLNTFILLRLVKYMLLKKKYQNFEKEIWCAPDINVNKIRIPIQL